MDVVTVFSSEEAPCFNNPNSLRRARTRQPNFQTMIGTQSHRLSSGLSVTPMHEDHHMSIGTVKFFNTTKGFGFISPDGGGKDVFVHATAVETAGMRSLEEGQRVSFDVQPDARGSKAVNLRTA
jgi:cold shock protein